MSHPGEPSQQNARHCPQNPDATPSSTSGVHPWQTCLSCRIWGISASPPPLHPGMMGVWTRASIRKFVAQAQGRCLVEAGTALQLRCNQFPSRPWS